tara:strand:- start:1261 stop:3306 length:2046 start_codon:yes stop_codon:yes gene_type:complete
MNSSDNFLGKGKFGNVIKIENHLGEDIALKKINPIDLNLIEIDILSRVKSPYLLRSIGEIDDNVSENFEGIKLELKEDNLRNLNTTNITSGQTIRIIMSLIYGLECLHKSGFLHLDLKPLNCLYDYKNGIYTGYLSDFGFSLRCEDPYTGIIRKQRAGSLKYYPYEFLNTSKEYVFNDKSDVWSLGVTILSFLRMDYNMSFKIENTTEEKTKIVKNFWDKNSPQKLIHEQVNSSDLAEKDKIDLIELLTNMLKKDRTERISSKDFKKLRFYNNNTFDNTCYVSKPKEILYIPYSSYNVLRGINQLNSYFERVIPDCKIQVYFLSIEIFIRIMAITPMQISNQTLESHIQKSFLSALNYYKETNINLKMMKDIMETGYDVSRYLNGDIAPNIYFYGAKKADDLYLVKDIIFRNYNLICLYNYLDIERVFEYFQQNYKYSSVQKDEIKTFSDLMKHEPPVKGTKNMIENDRDIFSYKNLQSREKLNKELVTSLILVRQMEEKFVSQLNIYFSNVPVGEKKIEDIFRFYVNYFTEKNISISKFLLTEKINSSNSFSERFCNYGMLIQDIFDRIEIIGDIKNKHIIFNYKENYSLVVIEDKNKTITHYFSTYNDVLSEYLRKNFQGYKYSVNYELKTSSVCKINEICIVFLIFYNLRNVTSSYDMVYISDETLKRVLEICSTLSV